MLYRCYNISIWIRGLQYRMRRKIAVLVAQIDETTQKRFLIDFISQAYTYDYDICVFSMYQKYQETLLRGSGDANIFKLINFSIFDAVLMLLDTIQTPGLNMPLQNLVKKNFDGPVIVVDQESPFFDSVMMDHYTPVRNIIDHLIEVHHYRDIAFLGGKEGHPHSVQRLNAFRDSMEAHNVPINEKWVYHGNYWYDSAEAFVDILLEDREHLPQVLACANDCMAIGAAARFTENGIRVPEDIAITGYDSMEDGRYSPAPITSANIPADQCGKYCMERIHSIIEGKPQDEFETYAPLFIGGSCGCEYQIEMVPKKLRPIWRTQQSSRSMFSDFNHILEDLLSQNNLNGFFRTIHEYSYQIRPFASFDFCMNDGFMSPDIFLDEEKAVRSGYTDDMYQVLCCKGDDDIENPDAADINLKRKFNVKELIPALNADRDYPTTFIFNPLFFDDRSFGYTVLNYGKDVKIYDDSFRIWMRNIMQAIEGFYRQAYMKLLIEKIKADQIRDTLTGLYNYDGFIKQLKRLQSDKSNSKGNDKKPGIMTIDVCGMKQINEVYGRENGEKVIMALARILQNSINDDEICCHMCNDEFLVALYDDEKLTRINTLAEEVGNNISKYRIESDNDYVVQIHHAGLVGDKEQTGEIEAHINKAISIKNHKKSAMEQSGKAEDKDFMDEIKRNQLVMHILSQNDLTYHYQPIVNVKDGSIYAYEALMRYEKEKITPLQIIQSAIYLKRLPDIEKATLLNVTEDVEKNLELFGEAKVFINSLPGVEIVAEDRAEFERRLLNNKGRYVVEFTEESELGDEHLEKLQARLEELGCNIAVDDFGAGYSNVNNLLRYMPRVVKIDRMLITEINDNPQKQHFVKSIIDFAHDNSILALAEGVENSKELKTCISMGVDLIQGYYTGKATRVPIKEINPYVRNEIVNYSRQSMGWHVVSEEVG